MTEPTPLPSRLLKAWSAAVQALLWLLMAAWLVFTLVWGALHGWIVPRVGDYLPQLEAQASRALGRTVRIGSASGETVGWSPTFEFRDVQILDARGAVALALGRVQASISPSSIWTLSFEQLVVDAPVLDIRRRRDGVFEIAGFELSGGADAGGDSDAADWVFSQSELALRSGTLRYRDEQRGDMPLELGGVQAVLRNQGRRHALRFDGTPPPEIGSALSLSMQMRHPLWSTHEGRWQDWEGQVYVDAHAIDLARLYAHVDWGEGKLASGRGNLRAWLDVVRGRVTGGVLDLALEGLDARLPGAREALALREAIGRVSVRELAGGFEIASQGLQFETRAGVRWPGGNVFVSVQQGEGRLPGRGEIKADQMDLGALTQIGRALPLADPVLDALERLKPRGRMASLQVDWDGPADHPRAYRGKGRVLALAVDAQMVVPTAEMPHPIGVPGVRGLDVDFEFTQAGGQALASIRKGAVTLPGVFEEPELPFDELSANLAWTVTGDRIQLSTPNLRFANADAEGRVQLQWQTANPQSSPGRSRFPGVLDLSGTLSRGQGTRVHRYLPQALPLFARQYVRDAVTAGDVTSARFQVRGDLWEFPFLTPGTGDFRVAAQMRNATYAYVPTSFLAEGASPWPALTQVSGELVFDRASMAVAQAAGRIESALGLGFQRGEARIPDLRNPVVTVSADVRGPAADMLAVVRQSAIAEFANRALDETTANGSADLSLRLQLPIAQLTRSRVQATLNLGGNDVRITPDSPLLARARGQVLINETGFSLAQATARVYGGDARIEGGSRNLVGSLPWVAGLPPDAALVFRATGQASAEALRQAPELGFLARLAASAQGGAAYAAQLAWRNDHLDVDVQTDLRGLALDLPAPLGKAADTTLALRYENRALGAGRDRLAVTVEGIGQVEYERDTRPANPVVVRGSIALGLGGGETVPALERGVVANVRLPRLDIDAWEAALSRASGARLAEVAVAPAGAAGREVDAQARAAQSYLPTAMAVRAQELVVGRRRLHDVVLGGAREGLVWRSNIDARELNGYLEFRQSGPGVEASGRLHARLARLTVDPAASADVESLLDEDPRQVPALDIVVDDFVLRGKSMGRLVIDAVNVGGEGAAAREWRLHRLALSAPDAEFSAQGRWAPVAGQARRRTVLDFKLDVLDGGDLLTRLGMAGVVKGAKGALAGQVTWEGSPLAFDYPSLQGQFNVDLAQGQFLKADPGIAKLLGVLSLQSLPRRLALDFRDVFSEGFAFDFVRGDVVVDHGIARTNNLQMKGITAAVLMEGQADIARETQWLKVVVVPEINAGTASLFASVINPAVGLGTFLAQMFLRRPLIEAATQEFRIDGTWSDPRIVRVTREPGAEAPGASGASSPASASPPAPAAAASRAP